MPEVKKTADVKAAETSEVLPGEDTAAQIASLEARITALESAPGSGVTKKTEDPNNPVWHGWVPELQGHING